MNNSNEEFGTIQGFIKEMQKSSLELIQSFPLWMRFNVLASWMENKNDESIDWKKINQILHENTDEYDYNNYPEINTKDQFFKERSYCFDALADLFPYKKCKCKKCNDTFTMNFSEIEYFRERKLNAPKKCIYCRKGIEKPKPVKLVQIKQEKTEQIEKTAIQIALEKAGVI